MKPVAIFRHVQIEGAGYFSEFLDRHEIPFVMINVDENAAVPADPATYSGLVFMGGSMSVNDRLPWIPQTLQLIRNAVAADIPVLGHCLGGQLISKALGATVSRNPVKEIGWGEVYASDNDSARAWLDGLDQFTSFHWHGETFSLPQGATHIMKSAWCDNQAYVIGKTLAMQCHVEMTADMIAAWCQHGANEINDAIASPGVQTPEEMQAGMQPRLADLNRVADRLYSRWIKGLPRQ
jgi:GMP synthase-like glutamine amidotransferase